MPAMHEYLLCSQLAPARHEPTLHVLAAVTGSRPYAFRSQHLLLADIRPIAAKAEGRDLQAIQTKKAQSTIKQERLVHDLTRDVGVEGTAIKPWRARIPSMPDAAATAYIARDVVENETPDLEYYQNATLFMVKGQYDKIGHHFVSSNVIIYVYRVLVGNKTLSGQQALENSPAPVSELQVLDPSGTYMVEVTVRFEDKNNANLAEMARKELQDVANMVKGVLDLRVPDRFALDTRVKGT